MTIFNGIVDGIPQVGVLKLDGDPLDWPLEDRPLIYVANYFTANPMHGIHWAVKAAEQLLAVGWLPLVPHVSFIYDTIAPHTPEFWYALDIGLLSRCDAMYVCDNSLTRTSSGVRNEIDYALTHGIPIFHHIVPAKERYNG